MKKIYLKPLTEITLCNVKTAMLAGSGTQGSIVDGEHNFDPIEGPVTPVGPEGPPSEAKGTDIVWDDDDEF